jgi:hypothetical protein
MIVGLSNDFQKEKRILVCSIAAYRGKSLPPGFAVLIRSCMRFGIQIRFFGFDKYWQDMYHTKFIHLLECIRALRNEYDYVIAVDAEDIVFLRPLEEIYEIATTFQDVTWCAERNCFPHPELASQYPMAPTSYKYLNGGGFFGKINDVVDCMEKVSAWIGDHNDDQAVLSKAYISGQFPIKLDYHCKVFQSLFAHKNTDLEIQPDHKIWNPETQTFPCILHANGKTQHMAAYRRFE